MQNTNSTRNHSSSQWQKLIATPIPLMDFSKTISTLNQHSFVSRFPVQCVCVWWIWSEHCTMFTMYLSQYLLSHCHLPPVICPPDPNYGIWWCVRFCRSIVDRLQNGLPYNYGRMDVCSAVQCYTGWLSSVFICVCVCRPCVCLSTVCVSIHAIYLLVIGTSETNDHQIELYLTCVAIGAREMEAAPATSK